MTDNVHLKVIVDDDFLDLRNPHSNLRNRPASANSKNRSSSINTQARISTVSNRDSVKVFPGLQKFIHSFNQKNTSSFKRTSKPHDQTIDTRFRRKVERSATSSRSDTVLPEKSIPDKEKIESSKVSLQNALSDSDEESKFRLTTCEKRLVDSNHRNDSIQKNAKVAPRRSNFNEKNVSYVFNGNEKRQKNSTVAQKKKCVEEDKECNKSSKSENGEEVLLHTKIMKHVTKNNNVSKKEPAEEEKIIRDIAKGCAVMNNNLEKLKWYDPTLHLPIEIQSIPSFKKSWTIPSFSLMKQNMLWARHYNALCAKVDRQTYEYDDLEESINSDAKMSTYSSTFQKNYMHLIFCFGCLSGILLVSGILTASEIQSNLLSKSEPSLGILELIFQQIIFPIKIAYNGFHQILILASELFNPPEPPAKNWGIF